MLSYCELAWEEIEMVTSDARGIIRMRIRECVYSQRYRCVEGEMLEIKKDRFT